MSAKPSSPPCQAFGFFFQRRAHARIELAQQVAAGPVGRVQIGLAVHGRHHAEMVVGEQEWQVGVGVGHFDDDGVVAFGTHIADSGEHALGRGLGVLAAVHVDRVDHVLNGHSLSVREFDALANLEAPDLRVGAGLPAFREVRGRRAVRTDIDDAVPDGPADGNHRRVVVLGGVERVDRVGAVQAAEHVTAALGCIGQRVSGPQGAGRRDRDSPLRSCSREIHASSDSCRRACARSRFVSSLPSPFLITTQAKRNLSSRSGIGGVRSAT